MIFVGDIASPNEKYSNYLSVIFNNHKEIFSGKGLVCNLEGLLSENDYTKLTKPVLFNHISVIDALKEGNVRAVGLANNHVLDLPQHYFETINILEAEDIQFVGASDSVIAVDEPILLENSSTEVVLFNSCWDFLLYHQKNPSDNIRVSVFNEFKLIEDVKRCKKKKPDARIVVYLHWSLDLEILPFPMYRIFAKKLIDVGANVIIGTHSHCVQGGEVYKNNFIIYGLGNFFLPNNIYANGKLKFPEFSKLQLAFDWDPQTNKAVCHWFEITKNNEKMLQYLSSEDFQSSEKLKEFSPFQTMNEIEYVKFFKTHRRKKFLVPLFKNYNNRYYYYIEMKYLKIRARLARFLAEQNLHKWQK